MDLWISQWNVNTYYSIHSFYFIKDKKEKRGYPISNLINTPYKINIFLQVSLKSKTQREYMNILHETAQTIVLILTIFYIHRSNRLDVFHYNPKQPIL